MSHHILHVFQHGAVLGRERGFITCKADGQAERRLPLDDVRAVIIAARGVTISSNFLSGLLETDAIVLHCDERYQPCGWTAPLARVVDLKTFQNQTAKPKSLNEKLWHEMLRGKTLNQSRVLQHKQLRSPHLELALKQEVFDEGNCARRYWQLYFPAIGWSAKRGLELRHVLAPLFSAVDIFLELAGAAESSHKPRSAKSSFLLPNRFTFLPALLAWSVRAVRAFGIRTSKGKPRCSLICR